MPSFKKDPVATRIRFNPFPRCLLGPLSHVSSQNPTPSHPGPLRASVGPFSRSGEISPIRPALPVSVQIRRLGLEPRRQSLGFLRNRQPCAPDVKTFPLVLPDPRWLHESPPKPAAPHHWQEGRKRPSSNTFDLIASGRAATERIHSGHTRRTGLVSLE